MLLLHDKDQH